MATKQYGEFRGSNMPKAARRAARANGLATIGSYDIVTSVAPISEYNDDFIVMRAYSPGGTKMVEITNFDVYYYETDGQDFPMARV